MINFFKNLISNRYLLLVRIGTELKTNVAGSALGYAWWILDPILLMAIYYFVVKGVLGRGGEDFHIFVLIGILSFQWFSRSVSQATTTFQRNKALILTNPMPYELYLVTPVIVQGFFAIIGLLLVALFVGVFSPALLGNLLFVIMVQAVFTIAISPYFAVLPVIFPDLPRFVDYMLRGAFFLSPIIFSADRVLNSTEVPAIVKQLFMLNPFAHIVPAYRDIIMNQEFSWTNEVYILLAISLLLLQFGAMLLKQSRNFVAQMI